jgi:hypothetical protein
MFEPKRGEQKQKGKTCFINKPTKTGDHAYDKMFSYIPTEVARDAAFTFKEEAGVHRLDREKVAT